MALPMPNDELVVAPYRSNSILVKRPWTPEEDAALAVAVQKYGASRWSMIATQLSTGRVGKQCRERWNNHLCPEVKKSEWSEAEDRAIMQGVAVLGTRWCEIIKAPALSGRTDNSIKNRFYALQRKMTGGMKVIGAGKLAGGGRLARQTSDSSEDGEPPPVPSRKERIMSLARELAFATYECDRDVLIEQLTAIAHESLGDEPTTVAEGDAAILELAPLSSAVAGTKEPDMVREFSELMPVGFAVADDLLDLLGLPFSPPHTATTTTTGAGAGAACPRSLALDGTGTSAPDVPDDESLPDLSDDSSTAGSSRASTASPSSGSSAAAFDETQWEKRDLSLPTERAACDVASELGGAPPLSKDITAACLGGRLAHRALLAPLCLPLDDLAQSDSPKRMRTTPEGVAAVPWHARVEGRRPSSLSLSHSSPLSNGSPASQASHNSQQSTPTVVRKLSPLCAATGTKEPGSMHSPAASLLSSSPLRATTGTKEPGMAPVNESASPISTMATELLSLADFTDLFGDEVDIGEHELPAISSGKRKATAAW